MPETPFDDKYFSMNTYETVSFAKYSQYWWSNRFYAILTRRYAKNGGRLLEEGCGLGHLVGQLEPDFETFGMDINHWALKQTAKVATNTHLVCSSAGELPYPNNSFHAIISKHVVEHLLDPEKAIHEIGRIISPGGTLILATPNLNSLLKPLKGALWIGYQDPTHISLRTPSAWKDMISSSGMKIVKTFADGFWDVPYIKGLPTGMQKLIFGSLGGFQAITGWVFLPPKWGESIIFIAKKA
jgi:ubiquinone/menaquinone biosynthesis C-methylase UbiE